MNQDFDAVRDVLLGLRSEYAAQSPVDVVSPDAPVTEADISSDIRSELKGFCRGRRLHVHCEIKPTPNYAVARMPTKDSSRIDVVILSDHGSASWLEAARKLQDQCDKGAIEARFSSVPVKFFHTAVQVKIQSLVRDARRDIDKLEAIRAENPSCNCFFVLLNARGQPRDHDAIAAYAQDKGIFVVEYTAKRLAVS